jgi:chorismate mutase
VHPVPLQIHLIVPSATSQPSSPIHHLLFTATAVVLRPRLVGLQSLTDSVCGLC